jgi:hypothetical protein
MRLIQADEDIIKGAQLIYSISEQEPGSNEFKQVSKSVEFQFPPRVTSDNRRGSWDEKDVLGTEPIVIFRGSSPRNINLSIVYICHGDWDCDRIKKNIMIMRGYFGRSAGLTVRQKAMIVRLKLWCIGGSDLLSFRCRSVDVKYSETMVKTKATPMSQDPYFGPLSGSPVDSYFPLKTEITLDLASWTSKFPVTKQQKDVDPVQSIEGLTERYPQDWF